MDTTLRKIANHRKKGFRHWVYVMKKALQHFMSCNPGPLGVFLTIEMDRTGMMIPNDARIFQKPRGSGGQQAGLITG